MHADNLPRIPIPLTGVSKHPFNFALRTYLDFEIDRKKYLYKRWLDRKAAAYNEDADLSIVDLQERIPEMRSSFTDSPVIPVGSLTIVSLKVPSDSEIEHRERYAVLYLPSSGLMSKTMGLMVLLHNLDGNCLDFARYARMTEYAERDGIMIASLCGSMGRYGIGFNGGTCCGFDGDEPDEEQFLRTLVNLLVDSIPTLDSTKIVLMGLDNGAFLGARLACSAPDIIRGLISLGGTTTVRPGLTKGLMECDKLTQKRRQGDETLWGTHILLVNSDSDVRVPWAGNKRNLLPPVKENLEYWLNREGCDPEANSTTLYETSYENLLFSSCDVSKVNYSDNLKEEQEEEDEKNLRAFRKLREAGVISGEESSTKMHPKMKAALESDKSKWSKPTVELVRIKGSDVYLSTAEGSFDSVAYAFEFFQRIFGSGVRAISSRSVKHLPPKNLKLTVDEIIRRSRVNTREKKKQKPK